MTINHDWVLLSGRGKRRLLAMPRPFEKAVTVLLLGSVLCLALSAIILTARLTAAGSIHGQELRRTRLEKQLSSVRRFTAVTEGRLQADFLIDDLRRAATGAPPISRAEREVGIGGPATRADIEAAAGLSADFPLRPLDARLDKLLRQTGFYGYGQAELAGHLDTLQTRLKHTPSLVPALGNNISGFGARKHPIFGIIRPHNGVDIVNHTGTPVLATADGTAHTGVSETFGRYVLINHHNGLTTIYAHLSQSLVKDGKPVVRGQRIGALGSTGLSVGPHLHYEVHEDKTPVDPEPFILPSDFIVD